MLVLVCLCRVLMLCMYAAKRARAELFTVAERFKCDH